LDEGEDGEVGANLAGTQWIATTPDCRIEFQSGEGAMGNRLTVCLLVVTACSIQTFDGAVRAQSIAADVAAALAGVSKELADTEALLAKTKTEEKKLAETKAGLDREAARLQREEAELRRRRS
jgi:hypothetical protein